MRSWVRDHYVPDRQAEYDSVEGKLRLLDAIIRHNWIARDETWKLQCLGITFGDALAQRVGLRWVAVEDESGRDPALMHACGSVQVFPMTSIAKRIEAGEDVDVHHLFEEACGTIARLLREGA